MRRSSIVICSISLTLLSLVGCGDQSVKQPDSALASATREDARKVVLDYANKYQQIFLKYEGLELETKVWAVEADYREQMSKLAQEGKWTPLQDMGKSIKLSFLMGQFHGAMRSCKIEKMHKDKYSVGCDQARHLKNAMEKLCSE